MSSRKPTAATLNREHETRLAVSVAEERRELIAALLRSDERAWRRFIHRYGPLIYRVVNGFPGLRDERDDAFQEICIIIHRSLGSLRDPEKLAVWVYSISHRHAADMIRKRVRNRTIALSDATEDHLPVTEPTVGLELEALERSALLLDLIASMRPRCRRIIQGLYIEDPPLTYEQLRERTGIPVGSIGPTRARCLDELRNLWNTYQSAGSITTIVEQGPGSRIGRRRTEAGSGRERPPRDHGRGGA